MPSVVVRCNLMKGDFQQLQIIWKTRLHWWWREPRRFGLKHSRRNFEQLSFPSSSFQPCSEQWSRIRNSCCRGICCRTNGFGPKAAFRVLPLLARHVFEKQQGCQGKPNTRPRVRVEASGMEPATFPSDNPHAEGSRAQAWLLRRRWWSEPLRRE